MNRLNDNAHTSVSRTDRELVTAAQKALPAFEHLYRKYVNDVYRFCASRLRSEQDATDATSQVFTKALSNIQTCDPESFRAWLFAIARNVVTDTWRSNQTTVDLAETTELEDPQDSPEQMAIASDERGSLLRMLDRLTEDQRTIIELRLAGLNASEIAAMLGKQRNAVDQAQYRAITRLRTLLAASQPTPEGTVRS